MQPIIPTTNTVSPPRRRYPSARSYFRFIIHTWHAMQQPQPLSSTELVGEEPLEPLVPPPHALAQWHGSRLLLGGTFGDDGVVEEVVGGLVAGGSEEGCFREGLQDVHHSCPHCHCMQITREVSVLPYRHCVVVSYKHYKRSLERQGVLCSRSSRYRRLHTTSL